MLVSFIHIYVISRMSLSHFRYHDTYCPSVLHFTTPCSQLTWGLIFETL